MPLQRGFPSDVVPRAGRGAKIGRVELHVLCSGTWDAAPSLLLTVERKETHGYLINCGEGTMRFCAEHHMRLTPHLTRVLFTRQTWEAIGGLPDVLGQGRRAPREGTRAVPAVAAHRKLPRVRPPRGPAAGGDRVAGPVARQRGALLRGERAAGHAAAARPRGADGSGGGGHGGRPLRVVSGGNGGSCGGGPRGQASAHHGGGGP
eukprot:scaffold78315_cov54-Phaeocystis_antarctica.AAC.5